MSKKLYASPAVQVMVCEIHPIMGGSGGKYDVEVDGNPTLDCSGKDGNPEDIDAKKYHSGSNVWDD